MNTGTQDLQKLISAATLTSLALFLMIRWLFPTEPAVSASGAVAVQLLQLPIQSNAHRNRKPAHEESLDPLLQTAKLRMAENTAYEGSGRNIFTEYEGSANAEPVKNPQTDLTRIRDQSSQPTAPALRLRFFGFATKLGWPQKVFLFQDGDVFIGSVGDVINRRYKIVHVGTTSVDIEDMIEDRMHARFGARIVGLRPKPRRLLASRSAHTRRCTPPRRSPRP